MKRVERANTPEPAALRRTEQQLRGLDSSPARIDALRVPTPANQRAETERHIVSTVDVIRVEVAAARIQD